MRLRRHANKQERSFLSPPDGGWIPFGREMLESPAYRALSRAGLQMIARICTEHAAQGGKENGRLAIGWDGFEAAGIHRGLVKQTVDEVTRLGFVRVTFKGRKGYGCAIGQRATYRLTFIGVIGADDSGPPTDDWRAVATIEEAEEIAAAVRKQGRRAAKVPRNEPAPPLARYGAMGARSAPVGAGLGEAASALIADVVRSAAPTRDIEEGARSRTGPKVRNSALGKRSA